MDGHESRETLPRGVPGKCHTLTATPEPAPAGGETHPPLAGSKIPAHAQLDPHGTRLHKTEHEAQAKPGKRPTGAGLRATEARGEGLRPLEHSSPRRRSHRAAPSHAKRAAGLRQKKFGPEPSPLSTAARRGDPRRQPSRPARSGAYSLGWGEGWRGSPSQPARPSTPKPLEISQPKKPLNFKR